MNTDILGYTILALILISGLPLLLFALKRGKNNADKVPDESEWYDENGNHIYYDRKLIRYVTLQPKNPLITLTMPNNVRRISIILCFGFDNRTHVGHSKWFLKCRERLDR